MYLVNLYSKRKLYFVNQALKEVEAETGHKFRCLISDAFLWFSGDIAEKMNVPWVTTWSGPRPLLVHLETNMIKEKVGAPGQEDKTLDFLPEFSNKFRASDLLLRENLHTVSVNVTQHNFTRIHLVNRVLIISGSTHSRQNVSFNYNPITGKHPLIPIVKKSIVGMCVFVYFCGCTRMSEWVAYVPWERDQAIRSSRIPMVYFFCRRWNLIWAPRCVEYFTGPCKWAFVLLITNLAGPKHRDKLFGNWFPQFSNWTPILFMSTPNFKSRSETLGPNHIAKRKASSRITARRAHPNRFDKTERN
ncbi:putative flavonol 3-O-glucosyltransferase [Rosa chinensis]|uniref:Putative flavonol 3-O-glucosyltransferase n=1 Tax=Rosa chinensis TaxID=74649 RepID=A0A2P6QQW4_ROSCH|nr:putative flavonol 3-O-glucosyltransferase [Rosa chinensis]